LASASICKNGGVTRLVAQGYTQEEGIDYDEVFALVARIEVIRLFLAYASFKYFVVYQIDVKSHFLYGKIEEEVYVCQPVGFEDPDFPDRVYKVEKALYGLHQAPRAWYKTLSTYLLDNEFQRGKIDKTLFIKRYKVQQKKEGIFISQDKYVDEILKKFGFTEVKTANTPMETQKLLLKDEDGKEVDVYMYRSMISSLMYFTSSRPDIMFAINIMAEAEYMAVQENNEAVNEEMEDSLVRAATIASSLEAEQDRGNIIKNQSKATPNEPSSPGTSSGGGPKRQETIGDTIAQTRSENVSKISNDPLLARGNTLQSGKDSLKLKELMELCTNLQNRVIDLEKTKTSQAQEITSLKRRVKRLEKKGRSRTHRLKRLYKVGLSRRVEFSDEEVSAHFDDDTDMFGVHDLVGDEVVVESEVAIKAASTILVSAATTTTTIITDDEITLAKALTELKSVKLPTTTAATTITVVSTRYKAKRIVIHEQEQAPTPTVSSQQPSQLNVQDKGKGKMVEPEPVKKLSKKYQLMLDEELAFKLQAEEEEE
ncbi:putative ribonuclease H-like domain-containing protein, partial [Tanacetum coccineum]